MFEKVSEPHCWCRDQYSYLPSRIGPLAIPHYANLLGTSGIPDEEVPSLPYHDPPIQSGMALGGQSSACLITDMGKRSRMGLSPKQEHISFCLPRHDSGCNPYLLPNKKLAKRLAWVGFQMMDGLKTSVLARGCGKCVGHTQLPRCRIPRRSHVGFSGSP